MAIELAFAFQPAGVDSSNHRSPFGLPIGGGFALSPFRKRDPDFQEPHIHDIMKKCNVKVF